MKRIEYKEGDQVGLCFYVRELPEYISPKGARSRVAEFKCYCGNFFEAHICRVKCEGTKSCGCAQAEANKKLASSNVKHGLYRSNIYQVWRNAKQRCYNKANPKYKDYGDRGITMCDEWLNDASAFINYATSLPNYNEGLSIERIDNDKGYEPDNLEWASKHKQSSNQRMQVNNSSGFTGVRERCGNFQVSMNVNGKQINFGTFPSIQEAVEVKNNYIITNGLFEYPVQMTYVA